MSRAHKYFISLLGGFLFGIIVFNSLAIREQQKAIEILESDSTVIIEHEQSQEDRIWDLHRRVKALEAEDERLLAHIKWFVMRRSGTNELRKMERAVARLEAAE